MREYSTDSPDFFVFKVDGKTYKIPTLASMPVEMLREMNDADKRGESFEWQLGMLKKYMGDVVEQLPGGVVRDILHDWSLETKKSGADAGESSASSES